MSFDNIYINYVNELIQEHFVTFYYNKHRLEDVCMYTLRGGKKIRASIAIDVCKTVSGGKRDIGVAALSVEYVHNASLIIDDLPCMDNAPTRRHMESVHVRYGESIAQMASVTLLSMSMHAFLHGTNAAVNAGQVSKDEAQTLVQFFMDKFSHVLGPHGATGGQVLDLAFTDPKVKEFIGLELEDIDPEELIDMKTGVLFEISFVLGWVFGGGDYEQQGKVKQAARAFSMVFQLLDDLADMEEDGGSTESSKNYAVRFGKEQTLADVDRHLAIFTTCIDTLGLKSAFFDQMIAHLARLARFPVQQKEKEH